MCSRCNDMGRMVVGLTILVSLLISSGLVCYIAFADDKSHYRAALQLVDLTYNEQLTYESAKKFALLAVKDRFENNPKTKDYGAVLTNLIMEVLDAYFHDVQTQNAIKMAFAKTYVEEFTEYELKEFIKFYRTPIGKKALQKLPVVMQKGWERGSEIGSQVSSSPKYEQMLIEKIEALQEKGLLPQEFK
jgi:uncharacterized protein